MDCPRCLTPLKKDNVKDIKITHEFDNCEKCGGTWFDQGELSKIDSIREPVFIELKKVPSIKDQLKPLSCPSCGNSQSLKKAEHPRDSKVVLDYCSSCKGIWLDKGELEAIQKENFLITIAGFFKAVMGV